MISEIGIYVVLFYNIMHFFLSFYSAAETDWVDAVARTGPALAG